MHLMALCRLRCTPPGFLTKTLRIMKLTAILLLIAVMHVAATGNGQTISISLQHATLEKVFAEIQKQSGYSFVYSKNMLQSTKTVDITVSEATIQDVLAILFTNQPFSYTIV